MSGTRRTPGSRDPIPVSSRPLPNNPSLEYERKNAKAFLKQLHAGDAAALTRVGTTHPASLRDHGPGQLKLADAQHVIAREYGFTSWPRMVEYFEELERHRNAPRYNVDNYGVDRLESFAQQVVRGHQGGNPLVARQFAHFVPRFFARPIGEILATPITDDEARLVVARQRRRASWDELILRGQDPRPGGGDHVWDLANTPLARAAHAVKHHDIAGLTALLDAHPEVLTPSIADREWRNTLGPKALRAERDATTPDARHVTELLAARGLDLQHDLNELLLGWPHDGGFPARPMPAETVRWYLDRGADPDWLPPSGIPILEYAIVRYRNPAAVDLIAARVTPRSGLWIAAGLGDVAGIRRFTAGRGRLTAEGRLNRPDLMALASPTGYPPPLHDADDLEIMYEAFQIAGWNQRWASMDALLAAGFCVDYSPFGWPLILDAVENLTVSLAEYLVSRGADLDREWPNHGSARAAARSLVKNLHDPRQESVRQLLAICSAGPLEEIQAALDATRPSPPPMNEMATRVLQLAADDAARQGQGSIIVENILIGVLRVQEGIFLQFLFGTDADMPLLRTRMGSRLLPDLDPLLGEELHRDAEAEVAFNVATREADSRRRPGVGPLHLWYAVISQEVGDGARLLLEVGTDLAKLGERLRSAL
ncbi:MAG: Clp protease N-terminal domain-containing protein [Gemmatimonadota bacterium]